jgi:hypothetical protein
MEHAGLWAAVLTTVVAIALVVPAKELLRDVARGRAAPPESANTAAAKEIQALGIPAGSEIAVVGDGLYSFFARPAGFRVTVDVLDPKRFWSLPEEGRAAVVANIRNAGAAAIVANDGASCQTGAGWRPIEPGKLCVLRLR